MATNTLHALTPDALVERLAASGLRGRGGGWFEAARKWRAVRVEGGEPFLVANGAEGEPGSYKDRFVMLRRPQDVVAGLVLAARAVGAREAVVFLKGSFDRPAKALSAAIAAASLDGLSVEVRRGDDGYVTGEETAVLEALEGRKPWPRPKPPLPAAVGFRGRPTLVQNVETLARVPAALGEPEAYRRGETAVVTVWGDVRRPGVREVPLGTPLRRVIDEHAGGATEAVGLVFPGGPAGMPLRAADLDVPLDPESLRAKGTALGTGAILVVGESACPLAVAASVAGFFERENCLQCPPCSVGTASLARILRAVESGGSRRRDLRDLSDVAGFMSGHGYCAHCRTAAAVATGMARGFADAVEAHVVGGGCPWPERRHPDPFAPGSPERAAVEAAVQEQLR
ncbi:MAG TPA: NADH-ubiquinone oxidoreductase-F iron-sulfur binding region domain-containing protein [Vicinamibacteria bacterium]|nr:NADH-ubiquinone oxidoreductase-F iron-sulfur binding region domain-containing protein [Vicinamibacteria bacterium]